MRDSGLRPRRAVALLLTAGLTSAGCTGSDSSTNRSSPSGSGAADHTATDASRVCAEHYEDVRHAQLATVGSVRTLGPAVVSPPPGPLDAYADDEPIALCLVPSRGEYDVMAVVLADGATFLRWTQNLDDTFYWPI